MAEEPKPARPLSRAIPLEFPKTVDGVLWNEVHLARLSAGEVRDFEKKLSGADDSTHIRLPIFRDASGAPVPENVLDALDDDDILALEEASRDFLPRRFLGPASAASTQGAGAATPSTSAE